MKNQSRLNLPKITFLFLLFFTFNAYSESIWEENTSLYWQKCSTGLSGENCEIGSAKEMDWENANQYCNSLKDKNLNWRLPNLEELKGLVLDQKKTPRINEMIFPGTIPKNYWGQEDNIGRYPFVNFYSGDSGSYASAKKNGLVRCVAESGRDSKIQNADFIKTIKAGLPDNWLLTINNSKIIIERGEKAWRYFEDKSNIPSKELTERQIKKIIQKGEHIDCKIVLRAEKKWDSKQFVENQAANTTTQNTLIGLPKKYQIAHLFNKSTGQYISDSIDEEKKIKEYQIQKKKLESELIRYPDYEWDENYLFIIEKSGLEEEFYSIYPKSATDEFHQVLEIFNPKRFKKPENSQSIK